MSYASLKEGTLARMQLWGLAIGIGNATYTAHWQYFGPWRHALAGERFCGTKTSQSALICVNPADSQN